MLTGRPAEEMPGSAGDLLPEPSQLHEQVRQVMQGIAQALWPSISLTEGLGELAVMEAIGLPPTCQGSLGHGEEAVSQGCPNPHGRGRTCGARWERNPCQCGVSPSRVSR